MPNGLYGKAALAATESTILLTVPTGVVRTMSMNVSSPTGSTFSAALTKKTDFQATDFEQLFPRAENANFKAFCENGSPMAPDGVRRVYDELTHQIFQNANPLSLPWYTTNGYDPIQMKAGSGGVTERYLMGSTPTFLNISTVDATFRRRSINDWIEGADGTLIQFADPVSSRSVATAAAFTKMSWRAASRTAATVYLFDGPNKKIYQPISNIGAAFTAAAAQTVTQAGNITGVISMSPNARAYLGMDTGLIYKATTATPNTAANFVATQEVGLPPSTNGKNLIDGFALGVNDILIFANPALTEYALVMSDGSIYQDVPLPTLDSKIQFFETDYSSAIEITTLNRTVYRTTDLGLNWTIISEGSEPGTMLYKLYFKPVGSPPERKYYIFHNGDLAVRELRFFNMPKEDWIDQNVGVSAGGSYERTAIVAEPDEQLVIISRFGEVSVRASGFEE